MTTDIEAHWQQLVTVALLGADRRDPPVAPGPIGDLVADAIRATPAERMLADVAATTAVRRAGLLPAAPAATLGGPNHDDRPVCVPAAVDRWRHIVTSWPVLEDEWMLTVIERGWRVDPQLVPAMLSRHRRDPTRWARVVIATGPLAQWLVDHVEALAPVGSRGALQAGRELDAVELMNLPPLPIPPELDSLRAHAGDDIGRFLAGALDGGTLGVPHRAVLVNLIARVPADSLDAIARHLDDVDPMAPLHGLGASLADLARTRAAMLDELS